jgi:Sec-independent protein secretion pathway component TatC
MRQQDRRAALTNTPLAGLIVLVAISIAAWLWVSLANVTISASIHGPVQAFLLGVASLAVYLLWLAAPVAAITWLVFKLPDLAAKRPAVRVTLLAVGVAAAVAGVYFAYLTGGVIWEFVSFLRGITRQPAGLAGPAVMIVGFIMLLMVVGYCTITALLLLIAFWALEPRRRWHSWRSTKSELPRG